MADPDDFAAHRPRQTRETLSNVNNLIDSLQRQIIELQTRIILTDAKIETFKARLDFWETCMTRRSGTS
jgi:hypothetical protein